MSLVFRQASSAVFCSLKFERKCCLNLKNEKRNMCVKYLPVVAFENDKPVGKIEAKIRSLNNWYEEVSGLKDVKIAQGKVTEASDRLAAFQEYRRQCSAALAVIQNRLKRIYADLENTRRGDDRFVQLITKENKLLKEEDYHKAKLKEAEMAERDQFTILMNAVKNSHEKERFHSRKTQYWSIIGSVIGALLGIIGTSINNTVRFSKLKEVISTATAEVIRERLDNFLQSPEIRAIVKQIYNIDNGKRSGVNKELPETLNQVNETLLYAQQEYIQQQELILKICVGVIVGLLLLRCMAG